MRSEFTQDVSCIAPMSRILHVSWGWRPRLESLWEPSSKSEPSCCMAVWFLRQVLHFWTYESNEWIRRKPNFGPHDMSGLILAKPKPMLVDRSNRHSLSFSVIEWKGLAAMTSQNKLSVLSSSHQNTNHHPRDQQRLLLMSQKHVMPKLIERSLRRKKPWTSAMLAQAW